MLYIKPYDIGIGNVTLEEFKSLKKDTIIYYAYSELAEFIVDQEYNAISRYIGVSNEFGAFYIIRHYDAALVFDSLKEAFYFKEKILKQRIQDCINGNYTPVFSQNRRELKRLYINFYNKLNKNA